PCKGTIICRTHVRFILPLQGVRRSFVRWAPGRCPGLTYFAPSGRRHVADARALRRRSASSMPRLRCLVGCLVEGGQDVGALGAVGADAALVAPAVPPAE